MHYSIKLNEKIGVSDFIKAETEIDAVIYRHEFEKHRQNYLKSKSESELIFCFIFLQIYIECFLHQNMRKVVELEFKPPRDTTYTTWVQEKKEKRHISQKIDSFAILFFSPVPKNIKQSIKCIKDRFKNISKIRNLFAHGHKISSWSDSKNNSGISPARSFLTESQFNQSISEINELGLEWNGLLDNILPKCDALRSVEYFKFSNI